MKFTAVHVVIIGAIILLGFFGLAGYDMYIKNQPVVLPVDVVEEAVMEIFESDSVIAIPIEVVYEYSAANFETNGDTTYWYFQGDHRFKGGDKTGNSRVIMFPYSHFNFLAAADLLASRDPKKETDYVFINDIQQISKASYLSYKAYAKKY